MGKDDADDAGREFNEREIKLITKHKWKIIEFVKKKGWIISLCPVSSWSLSLKENSKIHRNITDQILHPFYGNFSRKKREFRNERNFMDLNYEWWKEIQY